MIYFAQVNDYIKIGYTTNVKARMEAIQAMTPYRLKLLKIVPGEVKKERELHRQFEEYKIHGEWFKLTGRLKDFIGKSAVQYTNEEDVMLLPTKPETIEKDDLYPVGWEARYITCEVPIQLRASEWNLLNQMEHGSIKKSVTNVFSILLHRLTYFSGGKAAEWNKEKLEKINIRNFTYERCL